MRTLLLGVLASAAVTASAEQQAGTHELVGQIGSRAALMTLHATRNPDASWQLAGEYLLLPTLQRRFLEGESSPEIGVTTLREGATAILFGRSPTGELRGVWQGGVFRGTRFAPGGQERERFELSETFPSLEDYSGAVRCDARTGNTAAQLTYAIEAGKVHSFEWRSQAGGHACRVAGLVQQPMQGGIRLASGGCQVTLRQVGESLRVAAQSCGEQCGAAAEPEPLLVDRRGHCELLRPQAR